MKHFLPAPPATLIEIRREFYATWRDFERKRDRSLATFQNVSEEHRKGMRVMSGLSPGLGAFVATQRRANWLFVRRLIRGYADYYSAHENHEFFHVTLVDAEFAMSDEKTILHLNSLRLQQRRRLSAMSPHWVATVEMQAFANRRHHLGGKVISPHVHAVVHGPKIAESVRGVVDRLNAKFPRDKFGCAFVVAQPISSSPADLARVLRYPHKGHDRCKTDYVHPTTARRNVHESEAGDRFVRYLRMFQILSLIERDRLVFASGDGIALKNAALRSAHDFLDGRTQRGDRQIQLQWVQEFWSDFMPQVGLDRFQPPRLIVR